jgi:hypothetical protein
MEDKEHIYDALYKRCTRRNFVKLVGVVIGSTIFGSYVYRGLEMPNTYYQIYESNKIAKALNIQKNSIDFQDSDHYTVIQNVLDSLPLKEKKKRVILTGNFVVKDTIKIPSHTIFELDGSLSLDNNVGKVLVTQAYMNTGDTNIEMIGGIYDANKDNQRKDFFGEGGRNHAIEFPKVVNSSFSNIIVQNAGGDGFVLDTDCSNNNIENVISRNCGITGIDDGNGLDDRGDHNTWTNCIGEDNESDNWVIKCRNSTFINCIGRRSKGAVGFGLFADRDISGNQFIACEAYDNKTNGMSLNLSKKARGKSIIIEKNKIQGIFCNNGGSGLRLRNVTTDGLCKNNIFDVLTNNNGIGFAIEDENIYKNNGIIVTYDNKESDCYIGGQNNTLSIFAPKGRDKIKIESGNNVNYIDSNTNSWAVEKWKRRNDDIHNNTCL